MENKIPTAYVTFARGKDVAWENNRIAFRVFNYTASSTVGSGVDVLAKSVSYPVLDKWYKLSEQGISYHDDRGEGCDFYNMGKLRGCGGIAIWIDGKPYPAEPFDRYLILKRKGDLVKFRLYYETWNVPGFKITEQREIELGLNTNLCKITSTIQTDIKKEITIAIGLTTYGNACIYKNKKAGILSIWEEIESNQGSLGTAILANPKDIVGYASFAGDEYILVKVQTNTPFTYFAGAGWSKSIFYKDEMDWLKYLKEENKKQY